MNLRVVRKNPRAKRTIRRRLERRLDLRRDVAAVADAAAACLSLRGSLFFFALYVRCPPCLRSLGRCELLLLLRMLLLLLASWDAWNA